MSGDAARWAIAEAEAALRALDDETVTDLFRYACAVHDDDAADRLEAEVTRRGIYGRKKEG